MNNSQSKTLIIVGISLFIVGVSIWYKRRKRYPQKWKKVGELTDLMCFPIKSCGVIRENEMECTNLGLQKGKLRDRTFMIIDLDGKFVTARKYPSLVKVSPSLTDTVLTLTAPGMINQTLNIEKLYEQSVIRSIIWGEAIEAVDCGEEVAKWFSRFILSEDTGLRLVYYPNSKPGRKVREKNTVFKKLVAKDSGAFPDCTSYMLMSENSVIDLNSRLDVAVTAQQFRPNFVVKGPEMYAEDNWDWVKIGNVVFQNVKPCTRCIFTTIDPETGIKDKDLEPLKTLKEYRQITDPELRRGAGESPVMGIHLGLRQLGTVKLGDSVYIPEEKYQ